MTEKSTKTRAQLRAEQRSKTQERETLVLIQESKTMLRSILVGSPELVARSIELINEKKDKEIVRLRRALIAERTHRERLADGLIPRLRSKANEVRVLRTKLYGHEHKTSASFPVRNKTIRPSLNGTNAPSAKTLDNRSVVVDHG